MLNPVLFSTVVPTASAAVQLPVRGQVSERAGEELSSRHRLRIWQNSRVSHPLKTGVPGITGVICCSGTPITADKWDDLKSSPTSHAR